MSQLLILGSASERRQAILGELGVPFEILIPDVVEVFLEADPPGTARENARRKHEWCRSRRPHHHILAADTIVAFEGRCVTKPSSLEEAARFLHMFSGKPQSVFTALAMSAPRSEPEMAIVESTVTFRTLSPEAIQDYLSKVIPLDKAGGYDINQHGDLIVESYSGSYTNIMGLPKEAVAAWLDREGLCLGRAAPGRG
ncbi:MAG: Maf family nucleotide pyrophosphatase, partial [Planctomycetota bacterium]